MVFPNWLQKSGVKGWLFKPLSLVAERKGSLALQYENNRNAVFFLGGGCNYEKPLSLLWRGVPPFASGGIVRKSGSQICFYLCPGICHRKDWNLSQPFRQERNCWNQPIVYWVVSYDKILWRESNYKEKNLLPCLRASRASLSSIPISKHLSTQFRICPKSSLQSKCQPLWVSQ